MARVKRGTSARKRRKRVLKQAKGYYGSHSKLFRTANQQVMRALNFSYVGRKRRKRDFRQLWIQRINAAARMNGLSYSRFINGLRRADIEINRKMLSEIAIHDEEAFAKLVDIAKDNLA